jgi:murein DD-endopeptidase MepM/ murein hydrolase activator NlpD
VSKGYDTYYGECRSGGNYLVVKYDSGHHIAYLHLENTLVKSNQKVKKGDLIAVSGNSGAYNCQPLGYHLHFELRKGRRQSTHIDPVPFIDINWDLVKTNMSSKYPKRLSGDNPHPKF